MKKILVLLVAVAFLFALAGCGSKDAEYYKNHPKEMKEKMEECKKMSDAEKMADRECAAVSQADSDRFYGDKMERPLQGSGKGRPTKQY